jgi:iron complex outermembrane recepter protein
MKHHTKVVARIRRTVLSSAIASLAAAAGAQTFAQSEEPIEVIFVSGSRIASTTGFTTPTPVTTLNADEIERLNITNIGAGLNMLPAFRPSTTPTTNGWGSFNVGAQIVNLRGLGVNRNLVLVDGRRFAPVTREGTVDLNLIPSGLVQRTDVVTGGASAAYGSDAVAGAVNIILNKTLTGIKGQIDFAQTGEGDGDNVHMSLAGGMPFADGRGHFVIGGEYDKQQGIGDCFTRSWCQGGSVITNAGSGAVAGLPAFVRSPVGGGFIANPGGVITGLTNPGPNTAAIRNLFGTGAISFDQQGNPIPYTLGSPASGITSAGGDAFSPMETTQLQVPVERHTIFAHADYEFSDRLRGFVEGSLGRVSGDVLQSRFFGAPLFIFPDNPYVPDDIRALINPASATPSGVRPGNGAAAFNMAVLGQRRGNSASTVDTHRITFGLDGDFADGWRWDTYYQYADTDRSQRVVNNLVTGASRVINRPGSGGISNPESLAYWSWATDAVYNPADAALPENQRRIVCRATISPDSALAAAAAGCVPFNPFGEGRASTEALDYVYRTLEEDISISQHVVAANVQGPVASLWAGDLTIATGVEYRKDQTRLVHDDMSNSFAYFQNFGADYAAEQEVYEAYVEAELPLVMDAPWVDSLVLNAAARRTRYEISGVGGFNQSASSNDIGATSWKVGLLWDPTDWLRFRATRSRDIRAPNFNEMFQASASTFSSIINRFVPGNPAQFPVGLSGGNPLLDAERSITTTYGMVIQPSEGWLEGVRFSADYYDINVNGYIGTPGGSQNIVDRCFFFNEPLTCPLIVFGENNELSEIRNVNVNLQSLRSEGVDLELAYNMPVANLFPSLNGNITARVLSSHTMTNESNLFGVLIDRAGETGGPGVPEWLTSMFLTYSTDRYSATWSGRYISSGIFNALWTGPDSRAYDPSLPLTVNDNRVNSAFYMTLAGSYNFNVGDSSLQLFAQVNNLANRKPPSVPGLQYPTNPVYFDQIGRSFRVGVRFGY